MLRDEASKKGPQMSEPYPSGQQPGYQPSPGFPPQSQGFAAPQQGRVTPPNPYSSQQGGYAPQNGGHAPQGYGQPGGYPPHGYGQVHYAGGPQAQRPGAATGASVLGIISGSLGIVAGFAAVIALSALQSVTSAFNADAGILLPLGYLQAFGTFVAAVALLASGITFLKGKGYNVLLIAACAQAVLVTISLILNAMYQTLNGPNILGLIIGYGLAGTTIFLMLSPAVKQWKK